MATSQLTPKEFFNSETPETDLPKWIGESGFGFLRPCFDRGVPDDDCRTMLSTYVELWLSDPSMFTDEEDIDFLAPFFAPPPSDEEGSATDTAPTTNETVSDERIEELVAEVFDQFEPPQVDDGASTAAVIDDEDEASGPPPGTESPPPAESEEEKEPADPFPVSGYTDGPIEFDDEFFTSTIRILEPKLQDSLLGLWVYTVLERERPYLRTAIRMAGRLFPAMRGMFTDPETSKRSPLTVLFRIAHELELDLATLDHRPTFGPLDYLARLVVENSAVRTEFTRHAYEFFERNKAYRSLTHDEDPETDPPLEVMMMADLTLRVWRNWPNKSKEWWLANLDPEIVASPDFPIRWGTVDREMKKEFNFESQLFFLVQNALGTGFLPAQSYFAYLDSPAALMAAGESRKRQQLHRRIIGRFLTDSSVRETVGYYYQLARHLIEAKKLTRYLPLIEALTGYHLSIWELRNYARPSIGRSFALHIFYIRLLAGEIESSLTHRGLVAEVLVRYLQGSASKPDQPHYVALLDGALDYFVEMEERKSFNKWAARPYLYQLIEFEYTGKHLSKDKLLEVMTGDQTRMMRFFDSLFGDLTTQVDSLYERLETIGSSSNPLVQVQEKGRIVKQLQYLEKMIGFTSRTFDLDLGRWAPILSTGEVAQVIATSGMKLLSDYSNRFDGVFKGFTLGETPIIRLFIRLIMKMVRMMNRLREIEPIVDRVVESPMYTPEVFDKFVADILGSGEPDDDDQIELLELSTQLQSRQKALKIAAQTKELTDSEEAEWPDEFLDPIFKQPIEDPHVLPTSKPLIVDKGSLTSWLLNNPKDPFNNAPLTYEEFLEYNTTEEATKAVEEFQRRVAEWRASRK